VIRQLWLLNGAWSAIIFDGAKSYGRSLKGIIRGTDDAPIACVRVSIRAEWFSAGALRIRRYICGGLLLSFFFCSSSFAGIFFSHPRQGQFRFVPPGNDSWYYVNSNQIAFQTPDKWQHYMGNYLLARPVEKILGKWPTIALFTSANVLKEVEDGYREGASIRDLGVGISGMLLALINQKLVCIYDEDKILFRYSVSLN
jgi:hypothetical protein